MSTSNRCRKKSDTTSNIVSSFLKGSVKLHTWSSIKFFKREGLICSCKGHDKLGSFKHYV